MPSELLLGSYALLGLKSCKDSDQHVEIPLVSTETGLRATDQLRSPEQKAIASLFDGTSWMLIPNGLIGEYSVGYLYALGNRNRQPDPTQPAGLHPEEGAAGQPT